MKHLTLFVALFCCAFGFLGNANAQVVSFCKIDTDSQKSGWQPFPLSQVPEATTGFRLPVGFTPTSGFTFNFDTRQDASHPAYTGCTAGGWVFHPGWDMNYPSYSDYEIDNNLPFYAAATGRVVWIGPGTLQPPANGVRERVMDQGGWASIVIQHNYQGKTYFTQYGHARAVNGNLNCGDTVQKGWVIGWIGKTGLTGTATSHLHYEIRKENHPDPIKGGYFCDTLSWDTAKYALQERNTDTGQTYVSEWYENPNGFHSTHGSYANSSVSTGAPLAIVSRAPDILEAFWIGSDGALWTNQCSGNPCSSWKGAVKRTANGIAPSGAPVSAIARFNTGLDVFWVGNDGAIYTMWFGQQLNNWVGGWNGPFQIVQPNSALSGKPVSVQALPSSRLDIFWVKNDGSVWSNYWDDSVGSWNSGNTGFRFTPLGFVPVNFPISTVSRFPNTVDIFWTDSNGAIITKCYNRQNGSACGAKITNDGVAVTNATVSVMARFSTGLDIFWRGNDGAVWSKWYTDGGGWRSHFPIKDTAGKIQLNAVPSVQSRPNIHIDVFWSNYDGSVWTNSHDDSSPSLNWPNTFQRALPRP